MKLLNKLKKMYRWGGGGGGGDRLIELTLE